MGNISKGYLVAKSFSTGAEAAADHIRKVHKKEIVLSPLGDFPITHHLTDKEREDYF